jgi:hypothetical protein
VASDCIDSKAGGFLREVMKKSVPEIVADCGSDYDFGELWEARLHWGGCPACRPEFAGVPAVFTQVGVRLENRYREALFDSKDNFLAKKASLLAAGGDLLSAYPEIIVEWALWESDVGSFLCHGQEALSLRVPIDSREEREAWPGAWEPNLSGWREFIRTLEFDVRCFVYGVMCSHDLLMPIRERMDSEYAETGRPRVTVEATADLQQRMEAAVANSQLQPDALLSIIETASLAYSIVYGGPSDETGVAAVAQRDLPERVLTVQETQALQGVRKEWKRDFDNMGDSLDSLKAGQMEIVRLFEQHRRPATSYEPSIAVQLGEPLYSRLHQMTQRALQVVEHLYNVNQEPDGFALTAIRMAQGYENELNVQVIGPFVIELLAAGTQTYDAQGKSREPLICRGEPYKHGMTLGSWAWYLARDPIMRSKVAERGFDVKAISKDATWVSEVRNKAAHDFACDRTLADELRRRILCRDSILSRLHPMMATAVDG